jgi:hypothetical protein
VDVPDPVTEGGVKLADAPAGTPLTESDTTPAKPFCAVTVVVALVEPPGALEMLEGDTAMVKSGFVDRVPADITESRVRPIAKPSRKMTVGVPPGP